MDDSSLVHYLSQDAETWNRWRAQQTLASLAYPGEWLEMGDVWLNTGTNEFSEKDLHGFDFSGSKILEVDFREADLHSSSFWNAEMPGAIMRDANLSGANLSGANLRGADLSGANLIDANFAMADLTGADLTGAYVSGTIFAATNLTDADLTGAYVSFTVFAATNLTNTNGLEFCVFEYPTNPIDHRTLQISGSLPLVFLRGCGMSDDLIDFIRSMTK